MKKYCIDCGDEKDESLFPQSSYRYITKRTGELKIYVSVSNVCRACKRRRWKETQFRFLLRKLLNPPTVGYNGLFNSMKTILLIVSMVAFIGLSSFDTTDQKADSSPAKTEIASVSNATLTGVTVNVTMQSNTAAFELPAFVSLVETQSADVFGPFQNFVADFCNYDSNGVYYCCSFGSGKPICRPETPPGPR